MNAELDDNLIAGAGAATLVEDESAGKVTGTHNWMSTGTSAVGLTGTVFGSSPGFRDAANEDFTLLSTSTAVGAASTAITSTLLPAQEYYRNETVARMYRARPAADDIGAFESTTTGPGTGPYGATGGAQGGATGTGGARGGASGGGGVRGTGGSGGIGGRSATGGFTASGGFTGSGGRGGASGGGGTSVRSSTGGFTGSGGHLTGGGGAAGMGAGGGTVRQRRDVPATSPRRPPPARWR